MDYLLLNNMQFYAYLGVNPQERKVGNHFSVDLKLGGDFSKACRSDQIEDTVNYAQVYEVVARIMKVNCNLIEYTASSICDAIKDAFPIISTIEIKLTKTNPPLVGQLESASILLSR